MSTEISSSSENRILQQFHGFLNTPPLWQEKGFFGFDQFLLKTAEISENLPAPEIPPGMVLGKRIERFFSFYIEHFSEEEILAENIQVISDKVTLGELDFILKNKKSGRCSHVEVVYKFYLYDPIFQNEAERWIGPNRRDTLLKKISRLKNQQFPLLHKEETQPLLQELKIKANEVQQKALFRANLFVPFSMRDQDLPLINNACITGFWIKRKNFTESHFGKYQFYSPRKQDWPLNPQYGNVWFSYDEIMPQLQELLNKQKSPLLWIRKNNREFSRIFLVWW